MYRSLFPLMGAFAAFAASAACGASTSSSDNKSAIDSALAAAARFGTGIFVPPGIFMTSGHHVPAAGVGIYGLGTLKLTAASTNPIIDTNSSGNIICGLSFDLSAGTAASRTAIDIDGGSSGTIVSSVTTRFGRIQSLVTNGGSPRSSLEYSRRAAATSTPTLETIPRTTFWGAA